MAPPGDVQSPRRLPLRARSPLSAALIVVSLLVLWSWHTRVLLYTSWTLVSLPFTWSHATSRFFISPEADGHGFDLSFERHSILQSSAAPEHDDRVPAVFHYVVLGNGTAREGEWAAWAEGRELCLELHPRWEAHYWTDDNAADFVAESFPEVKETWDRYPYDEERANALRYMVLYEYGGVAFDTDLMCKRSLGPLRRFDFVAASAPGPPHGSGIGLSTSFMMASRYHPFVLDIIQNLAVYDRNWYWRRRPAVEFSTGGQFASVIHTQQSNRDDLKILSGPVIGSSTRPPEGPASSGEGILFDRIRGRHSDSSRDGSGTGVEVRGHGLLVFLLPVFLMAVVISVLLMADPLDPEAVCYDLEECDGLQEHGAT